MKKVIVFVFHRISYTLIHSQTLHPRGYFHSQGSHWGWVNANFRQFWRDIQLYQLSLCSQASQAIDPSWKPPILIILTGPSPTCGWPTLRPHKTQDAGFFQACRNHPYNGSMIYAPEMRRGLSGGPTWPTCCPSLWEDCWASRSSPPSRHLPRLWFWRPLGKAARACRWSYASRRTCETPRVNRLEKLIGWKKIPRPDSGKVILIHQKVGQRRKFEDIQG